MCGPSSFQQILFLWLGMFLFFWKLLFFWAIRCWRGWFFKCSLQQDLRKNEHVFNKSWEAAGCCRFPAGGCRTAWETVGEGDLLVVGGERQLTRIWGRIFENLWKSAGCLPGIHTLVWLLVCLPKSFVPEILPIKTSRIHKNTLARLFSQFFCPKRTNELRGEARK